MPKRDPIAVVCSDLHLSSLQPACRADEDWWVVQEEYLTQLKAVAGTLPVICAGDIFDRWNPTPETINFALKYLPDEMLCVPGQHDLPNHRKDQMHRSGYGVLVEAGKILDISYPTAWAGEHLLVYGFGWDEEIFPLDSNDGRVKLAAIHRYCWTKGHAYPGAGKEDNLATFENVLQGYDAAVFGDNHKGFLAKAGKCSVMNCGGFIRRKSDEQAYRPMIGVLKADGTFDPVHLDTETDQFHEVVDPAQEVPLNMRDFLDRLENLGEHGLNFREAVEAHLREDDVEPHVREIVSKALEA